MGNPPFVGYSLQTADQKQDILSIYVDEKGKPYKTAGKIDYVSGWYFKAAELMHNTNVRTAFVSTNSITQGEQVAAVWKPLYDRFDIHIEVPPVKFEELRSTEITETSHEIKKRVDIAREIQRERFKESGTLCNAKISSNEFEKVCLIDEYAEKALKLAFESLGLTARAYDRVLKVARTIADLEQSEIIHAEHVLEAVQYRSLDRKYWASN